MTRLLLACLLTLAAWLAPEQVFAQGGQSGFDHLTTGFPLTGSHGEVRCETCHLKGIFKGTPRDCESCHGRNNSRTAKSLTLTHIPTSESCDTCHSTSTFSGARYSHVMASPSSCASCHNNVNAPGKPANHIVTTESCSTCHSTVAFAPATKGSVPANHIPYAASAQCGACHKSADLSVMPAMADIHANAQSTTTNCAQCHGAKADFYAIPSANFSIVGLPTNHLPTNASCETCHVGPGSSVTSTPVPNGARFSGSLMSHKGITNNCETCHAPAGTTVSFAGITTIVGMPPTSPAGIGAHIPSSTACETCHLGTLANVSGLIVANATSVNPQNSKFATPAPTSAQIHAGVTGGCSTCHEEGMNWKGMGTYYPFLPSTLGNSTTRYTGFHARPTAAGGATAVKDPAHPSQAAGDCSQCHSGTDFFDGQVKPSNHIPFAASAQCNSCHKSGSDYSVMPALVDIHTYAPSTTTNCAQCHGAAAASFAIPSANFSIVGLPNNHIPTSVGCESCHVGAGSSVPTTPVQNGAKFSGSRMSHAGITTNCASCHLPPGTTANFAGITTIVGMPQVSPMGPNSHIPSSTTCENCHRDTLNNVTGLIAANAPQAAPGSKFATPAPTTAQIHAGVTSGCSSCHEANSVWMGMSAYPISPTAKSTTTGAQYTGFQTRPRAAAGTYNVADGSHPSTGDCSQCHSGTNFFTGQDKPSNHIPYAATAQCSSCHKSGSDYSVMPALVDIHTYAPSTTTNCAQCHGAAAASFAIPAANFSIVGLPNNHIPTSVGCESCHVGAGSSVTTTPVQNGAKFSGSRMSHAGITTNCVSCHLPPGTTANFAGITTIVGMPQTSPMGANSHIPSSTTCESCHAGTLANVSGLIAANAPKTAPGSKFATPAPTTAQIHAGVTGGCSSCHDTGMNWMGMSATEYAISPKQKGAAGTKYTGFNTRPTTAGGTFAIADPSHPSAGDCSQCHSGTNFFSGQDKPANHIPYAATAQCTSCHKSGTDYSVIPAIVDIHTYAPSTTTNCAQCHGSAAASFAIPAANFSIVGLPTNHIPTSVSCESCHVGAGSSVATTPVQNGAKFSGSLMSHASITTNCVSCHLPPGTTANFAGITTIVGMPQTSPMGANSHIPSSTTCENCHAGTLVNVSGKIAANAPKTAPGTKFATPAPTTAQIHAGVTSGCSSCHEANSVWMGMGVYPINPKALTNGAQYTGFQTRPVAVAGTYSVADAAHPPTGDCAACHSNTNYFVGPDKPANHIPYLASANCASCHTNTDYSVMPTIANIHLYAPSTTTNCAQCHGSAAASFAIPAANFSIVGLPTNHIPTSAACESCHVGTGSSVPTLPVPNGAKFSGSRMSHAGITTNCVSCHVPSGAPTGFAGITTIVGMPATTPMGANAHIPSSTTCESCHLGTLANVSGLVAANAPKTAPGSKFATPAPTTAQIHAGVTSGCSGCHESNSVWMGMSYYPIAPTTLTNGAQYTGFQTRPRTAAGTYNVADPAHPSTGDCSSCHTGTNFFDGQVKPSNHIPYATTAQCTSCHTNPDFSVMPTLANIHLYAPSTTTNCAQCHGAAAASFAIPAANFSIVGLPDNHIPTAAACESCHVGAGSSVTATPVPNGAKFSGSRMSHAGITTNCVSCHLPPGTTANFAGITTIVGMPPTSPMGANSHIPSNTTCESCHAGTLANVSGLIAANAPKAAPGSKFATPIPTTAQIHAGVTSGCSSCHEANSVWMGVSYYPIAPTAKSTTAGTQYTGFQTRPRTAAGTYNVADAAHPSTGDCGQCHSGTNYFSGQDKPSNHIPYAATAQCNSCHTNTDYAVMPTLANIHLYAPSTTTNCAQCHGSAAASFAIPAANFTIVGLPTNHIPTSVGCESCHVGAGSSVPTLPVPNGAKFSGSLMSHAGITTNCVSCHVPAGTPAGFAGITTIVGMPPTSPMGMNAHIPSNTTCESCHAGTLANVSGLIAANAPKSAPGSKFATPAPTTAQIHAGVTGGCSSCHESNMNWMGMTAYYDFQPKALGGSGTLYTGFHARPNVSGTNSTTALGDRAHPTTGDCSQCHTRTDYFEGQLKPANHIPYAATAQCSSCHTNTDFSVMPTLANIHLYAQSTTTNCAQCHSATAAAGFAIPAANFTIVGFPSNHIPTSAACESCHVGAGSSVPTLPVPNGAKFSGSLMSHTGITTNCVSCHLPSGSATKFAGITTIVGMPPTSPMGTGAHIPSSTTCESCHAGTLANVTGLIAANAPKAAPGSKFATPAPTTAQIHSGITSGCSSCHDTNMNWMGMTTNYPFNPKTIAGGTATTQYTGFHSRPTAAGNSTAVADSGHPTTGDCSQCHSGTTYFSGQAKPNGHIPTQIATCSTCHVVAGDYSVAGLTTSMATLHTGITSGCISCHTAGTGAGPFAGCATQAACSSPPPLTYQPTMMPLAAGTSPTAPSKSTHVPATGIACEKCHSPTVFTSFSGMQMKNNSTAHTAVGSYTCITCHEGGPPTAYTWYGVTIVTRAVGHQGRKAGQDCIPCHSRSYNQFNSALLRPVLRSALITSSPHLLPGGMELPAGAAAPGQPFDHQGVLPGQCTSCHNGVAARGLPVKHLATKMSCDSCHRNTAWLPAQFNHRGVMAGQCASCHNAVLASGKPGTHFLTARSCDACHRTLGWEPVSYSHLSAAYRPVADMPTCVSCHVTNGEMIPRVLHGNPRVRPIPAPP